MNQRNELLLAVLVTAFAAGLAGSVQVAAWAVGRRQRGLPVLRYWPRRPAPWQIWDILLVVLVYGIAVSAAGSAVRALVKPQWQEPAPLQEGEEAGSAHPIERLVRDGDPWMLAAAGMGAVVVAPIVEEFMFRVMLQGWLEAAERRRRRAAPWLRRLLPRAIGPIVLTSLLFAALHIRVGAVQYQPCYLAALVIGNAVASVLTAGFAVGLLRLRTGATAADLGWAPKEFWADAGRGLVAFVAVAAPLYLVMLLCVVMLRFVPVQLKSVAPDPIPLFLFALVLGTLYHRTHRIVPSVVLHMSLNFTSLAVVWLTTLRQ